MTTPLRQSIKEAGYFYVCRSPSHGGHILQNENGLYELWGCCKNGASAVLKYKNTHLEFVSSIPAPHGK